MFGKSKSSKNKKSNNANTSKIKNSNDSTKHNNSRGYTQTSVRKPLPDLPKRETANYSGRYSNYGGVYTSSKERNGSYYGYNSFDSQRNLKNSATRNGLNYNRNDINRGTANRNKPYSDNYYNVNEKAVHKKNKKESKPGLVGTAVGNVSRLVRGSKISNSRIVNNKAVSAKRNSVALPIFVFFIILCFIYVAGSSVNFLTKKIVSYDILSYGTIDTPKSANAIVVRSEKVYNTDKGGVISYNTADNEKVKKGAVVCSIKDEAVVEQMQATLDNINEQIMKIQTERKDISVYSEDIKKYNSRMKDIIDESALGYAYINVGNIYELENNLQKELDTRNQYLLSENSDALKDLVEQKKQQESKLNENISNLTAEESGIVSYYIDELESEITPENMSEISKSTIADTVTAQSSFKSSVKVGSPAFKLVTSNIWYIVSYIKNDYIEGWEKGDTRYIYIKDENGKEHQLEAYIEEMVANESDEKFVIFKITKDMMDFINVRNVTIETESSERGFKIPNNAIVEETLMKIPTSYVDADNNVIKIENGSSKKINVSISGKDPKDGNYCYTPVQMGVINVGDTIKSPESEETFVIADVLNTKGIYVINTGIAEFKTINLTNMVSNSTHTILDPSYNTNIYVYDRIMTDPSNVKKQEMVYE